MNWTPLHDHDMFSFLDGFSTPKEYLDRIVELGLDSFAISNHGNQFSWVYYSKLLEEDKYKHIKMIYGVEFYEAFDMEVQDPSSRYFHLVVHAKNEKGRKALNELVTQSNMRGFYYKPRVDLKLFKELNCGDDIIVLTACLASKLAREKDYNKCIEYVYEYKSVFPNFYLEMQSHEHIEQELYNQKILQLSKDTNTPFVITPDAHASTEEELYYQGRHVQIAQDQETMTELYEGCYLPTIERIHEIMDKQIGYDNVVIGLENTIEIRNMVEDVKMPFQEPQLPSFPLPKPFNNSSEYLKHLVEKGWEKRKINEMSESEIGIRRKRIDYELSVIKQMGFCGYFVIVWDFINWARENGIEVGAGRGSGAGSLTCYLLGITDIDPIKYNLIFERFLNPERVSMPDIDIDFNDREPVIQYLINKYGSNNVCQIINFSYISPLNSIRDAFRVYGYPYQIANKISKMFSYPTFEECMEYNPTLYDEYPEYEDAFKLASKISGRVRGASIHAGGVGIVDTTISDYMGMVKGGNGEQVIQVDKRIIEEIGIIKFDLLGVSNLNILKEVKEDLGLNDWEINVNNDTFITDKPAYKILCDANTNAIFQVESQGMKDLLSRLQPHDIEEVSAVIALYRPDSMGALEEYIDCKHGKKEIEYIHDDMIEILGNTYGCLIYQEQLLDVVRKFGGRTYGGADKFRKGIAKKDEKLVQEESDKLYSEIENNGYDETVASNISNDMRSKGGYLFNRSHSFAYAVLCLQTAYLKAHYPVYFYKALFNLRGGDNGKLNKYIIDALENGVEVLPPNINKSEVGFTVSDGKVLFGLSAISGLGESAILPIIEERNKNGKFKSLEDLIERTGATESQLISLIKSGAIPCKSKSNMILKYISSKYCVDKEYKPTKTLPPKLKLLNEWNIDADIIKDKDERLRIYNEKREAKHKIDTEIRNNKKLVEIADKYMQDEEMWEFNTLSVFLTSNPFRDYDKIVSNYNDLPDGDVVLLGVVSQVVNKKNKQKQQYAFMNICTSHGLVQVACWAYQYKQYQDCIKKGNRLSVKCNKDGDSYSVKEIKMFEQWKKDMRL